MALRQHPALQGKPLQFSGWAIDAIGVPPTPAGGVFLTIDKRPPVWVLVGENRPNVASRFDARLTQTGFRLETARRDTDTGSRTRCGSRW
ncbi:MAG: hypothetical protein U0232_19795 [Thermomicrobiales bacterium]